MKKKWWIIPLVLLCSAAVLLGIFWDSVMVRVAPKAYLTSALTNTAQMLQTRFEGSPLLLLERNLDRNAQYDVQMNLEKSSDLLGQVQYDMRVRTDGTEHQFLAEGTVTVKDSSLDLCVYCNEDFAALTSQSLLKGNYYGITFDTFDRDIDSIKLLNYLVGQDTIADWKTSVSDLQKLMERDFTVSAPEISCEDIQMVVGGILTLKPDVAEEELEIDGQTVRTFRITFLADEQDLLNAADALTAYRPWLEKMTRLSVNFWIYEKTVIKLSANAYTGDEFYELDLTLDNADSTDNLTVRFSSLEETITISSDMKSRDSGYGEALEITKLKEGVRTEHTLDYLWNETTGDLTMVLDHQQLKLNLSEQEDGICIQTEDFYLLRNIVLEKDKEVTGSSNCTMYISRGADVSEPEYKNMDQWSANDLMVIFGSIGSLLGQNLG